MGDMGLTEAALRRFNTRRVWSIVLFENLPYTDRKLWQVIMDFLGCSNDKILEIKYPHVNPTRDVFSQMKLVSDDYVLDWKQFFENKIPIMMASHEPHRKIWFEYQEANGKYEQLL